MEGALGRAHEGGKADPSELDDFDPSRYAQASDIG